jgi:hypothetical protein
MPPVIAEAIGKAPAAETEVAAADVAAPSLDRTAKDTAAAADADLFGKSAAERDRDVQEGGEDIERSGEDIERSGEDIEKSDEDDEPAVKAS